MAPGAEDPTGEAQPVSRDPFMTPLNRSRLVAMPGERGAEAETRPGTTNSRRRPRVPHGDIDQSRYPASRVRGHRSNARTVWTLPNLEIWVHTSTAVYQRPRGDAESITQVGATTQRARRSLKAKRKSPSVAYAGKADARHAVESAVPEAQDWSKCAVQVISHGASRQGAWVQG